MLYREPMVLGPMGLATTWTPCAMLSVCLPAFVGSVAIPFLLHYGVEELPRVYLLLD
jgi:hypothetical protein